MSTQRGIEVPKEVFVGFYPDKTPFIVMSSSLKTYVERSGGQYVRYTLAEEEKE